MEQGVRRVAALALLVTVAMAACTPQRPEPRSFEEQEPATPSEDPGPSEEEEPAPPEADVGEPPVPEDEQDPATVGTPAATPAQSDDFPLLDAEPVLLEDARLVELPGHDRFVLELAGPVPSWRVGPGSGPVLEQPGGTEVTLAGEAHLEVRVVPATSLRPDEADPTVGYEGPTHLDGSGSGILEAVLTADQDGVLGWTLGLREEASFAVTVLEGPDRLVVDVVPSS